MFRTLWLTYKRASKDVRIANKMKKITKLTNQRAALKVEAMNVQKEYEEILGE